MKKRRHRVMVDVTFDAPVTARYARQAMSLVLGDADKERSLQHHPHEIVRVEAKEGERVIRAELRLGLAGMIPMPFEGYEARRLSDDDGYLLEAALQGGANMLNDDGTIYAFRQEDLIRLMQCALARNFLPLWEKPVAEVRRGQK